MAFITIVCGFLLIVLGIAGYGVGIMNGMSSPTALIPAAFGILLAILGIAANAKENLRKHIMHVAVLLGLIGFLATAASFLSIPELIAGTAARPAAAISKIIMSVICLVFVVLCVRSFINARRSGAV